MTTLDSLRRTPNALAAHYSRFRVADRLLLSGHSHQAWPDIAREATTAAFDDAADGVDAKWDKAFAKADEVRAGFRTLLSDPSADLALGASTHDLVLRLLSALDLRSRPRIVTTDGEFHTLRRQLGRLAEEGLDVVRVPAAPVDTLAERLAAATDRRTAAVFVSAVLFESARIVPGLSAVARHCGDTGAELVVDVYHALGAIPFSVAAQGLSDAWILGGGYKYLQLGEGNCFLRLPPSAQSLRPVITGWYAEFGALSDTGLSGAARPDVVAYATGGARFAGATYDPTGHYRAAAVFGFFAEQGLTPDFLRTVSRHQVGLLAERFDALGLPPEVAARDREVDPELIAGFLSVRCVDAAGLSAALARRGVRTDSRGPYLRFGPAPYLNDAQIASAMTKFGDLVTTA